MRTILRALTVMGLAVGIAYFGAKLYEKKNIVVSTPVTESESDKHINESVTPLPITEPRTSERGPKKTGPTDEEDMKMTGMARVAVDKRPEERNYQEAGHNKKEINSVDSDERTIDGIHEYYQRAGAVLMGME